MKFGRMFSIIGMVLSVLAATHAAPAKPNVLFIAIDDLNDWVGCYGGHPQVKTPHIDGLAARGLRFSEAHCAAPVCGPSRAAIMSGLATVRNGVYSNNANYPKRLPGVQSMPEYLRENGYHTLGAGKLFHGSHPKGAFDDYAPPGTLPFPKEAILNSNQKPVYEYRYGDKVITFPRNGMPADRIWQANHTFDWGPLDLPDNEFRDAQMITWAMERLKEPRDKPLFLGVGFNLPHQPLYAPRRFHDLYPTNSVILPPSRADDLDDLSEVGRDYALIPTTSGTHASVVKYGQWKNAVSSYLATASFVDHLIGQLIQTLEASSYADNTWIVLWSDHGWHLGEKEHWGKATGWYRSTRVPFIIVPPRSQPSADFKPGRVCERPVNLLDLYPTIVEMTGLPEKTGLDGRSLLPLLSEPDKAWAKHTITTFGRGNHAVSAGRWRYIQYFDGAAELYDRAKDPKEWTNLANHPECRERIKQMKKLVPEEPQWKHFIRYGRFKAVVPADGSKILLFNHGVQNHLEERTSEADKYPDVVAAIERWLKEHPGADKRIVIPAP
ncbi:MAG: sulfatase [Kiritimatiellales bacterium]|nr:sulfatase [Kiritimatiellales bacterium]